MTRSAKIRAEINNSPQQSIIEALKGILGKQLRASLDDPGLGTDPGQFSVEFFVYMIPG